MKENTRIKGKDEQCILDLVFAVHDNEVSMKKTINDPSLVRVTVQC